MQNEIASQVIFKPTNVQHVLFFHFQSDHFLLLAFLILFFCCFRQPMATCFYCASCLPHTVMKNQHKVTHKNAADGTSPRLFGGQTQHFTILKNPLVTSFLNFLQNLCAWTNSFSNKISKIKIDSKGGKKIQLTICNKIYWIIHTIQFISTFS